MFAPSSAITEPINMGILISEPLGGAAFISLIRTSPLPLQQPSYCKNMGCLYSITPDVSTEMCVPGSPRRSVRLFAAILLTLATVACTRQPSPTVFLDPALAVLVPRDTTLLAGIRMQRLKTTPFYDSLIAGSARRLEFRKTSGLADDS